MSALLDEAGDLQKSYWSLDDNGVPVAGGSARMITDTGCGIAPVDSDVYLLSALF